MAIWKLDGLITLHPYYVVQEELKGFNSVDEFGNLSRSKSSRTCMIRSLKIDQAQFEAKVGGTCLSLGAILATLVIAHWLMNHLVNVYTNAAEFHDGTFSGQGMMLRSGANARAPVSGSTRRLQTWS